MKCLYNSKLDTFQTPWPAWVKVFTHLTCPVIGQLLGQLVRPVGIVFMNFH